MLTVYWTKSWICLCPGDMLQTCHLYAAQIPHGQSRLWLQCRCRLWLWLSRLHSCLKTHKRSDLWWLNISNFLSNITRTPSGLSLTFKWLRVHTGTCQAKNSHRENCILCIILALEVRHTKGHCGTLCCSWLACCSSCFNRQQLWLGVFLLSIPEKGHCH